MQDLIKVSSFQVAPAELEALLLLHPAILEAAVTGVLNVDGTEQPRAFIVRRETPPSTSPRNDTNIAGATNAAASAASAINTASKSDESTLAREIEAWIAARVHKSKRLTGGVKFVAALPKGSTGKVIRRALREGRGNEGVSKL